MTIEQEVAQRIVHQERTAKLLAETGGEIVAPALYNFRMNFRDRVLAAMDEASDEHGMPKVLDRDLPELFRTLDALAEKLWVRGL